MASKLSASRKPKRAQRNAWGIARLAAYTGDTTTRLKKITQQSGIISITYSAITP